MIVYLCLVIALWLSNALAGSAFESTYVFEPSPLTNNPIKLSPEDVISQFNGTPRDLLLIQRYLYEFKDDVTPVADLLDPPLTPLDRGSSFLTAAANYASWEAVEFLLANGANPQWAAQDGITPLMSVIIGGGRSEPDSDRRIAIARALLHRNIEVNTLSLSGKTALDFVNEGPPQPRLRALLLEYGAKPGPKEGFPLGYPPVVVFNRRPSALLG